ncbi:hypothetical protein EJ02DRAFT_57963 [Clathrospora elynae]|uniref:Uncharacterized protein n=1 Tax=Clathrospora elynae TaxID=706981 RepID=A0A6A5SIT2_9PLEO|nr:hypothetical protein EJ02DRAFT_57963 [Clathrospora elynae]
MSKLATMAPKSSRSACLTWLWAGLLAPLCLFEQPSTWLVRASCQHPTFTFASLNQSAGGIATAPVGALTEQAIAPGLGPEGDEAREGGDV